MLLNYRKCAGTVLITPRKTIKPKYIKILLETSLMKDDKLEAIICYSWQKQL